MALVRRNIFAVSKVEINVGQSKEQRKIGAGKVTPHPVSPYVIFLGCMGQTTLYLVRCQVRARTAS